MNEEAGKINPIREAIADVFTEAMNQGYPKSDGDGFDRYHFVNRIGEITGVNVDPLR